MSAKKPNELIDRYEEMLRGTVSCYFDTDEIDEISDYYESKGQLSKALHAIEFGLNRQCGFEAQRGSLYALSR